MKTIKITYWILTVIIAVMMTYSAYMYLTNDQVKQAFVHLGFPAYFRIELAVAKLIGVVTLLLPVTGRVKEWTYAGFAIIFVSAFLAHISSGDPAAVYLMPLVFLLFLAASYLSYQKLQLSTQNVKPHTELSKSFAG
jgi:DoxX-like family